MAPHGGAEADEEGEGQLEDSAFVKPKRRKGQDATPAVATEPPEGGWGWMVAIGMAVMFVSTTGQYGSFALLFDGFLTQLGQETTGATLIMNAFTAAFNFTGLVTNHMLTRMSYRKVALLGGALFTTGILLTTFARTMAHALVTYSVLAGVGFGLIAPSSFLAFNSYFLRRRGFAMGICQAGIGLGFMASPPIITYLIREYSFSGTMLILSGVALHSLLGAALYQPIKWHMRKVPPSNGHAIVSEATDGQPTTKLHSKLADPTSMEEVEARQPLAMDCPAHDPSRELQSQPPLLRCAGDGPALLLPAASLPSIPKEWEEGQLRCYQRQSASLVNLGTIVLVLNNNSDLHTTCTASVDMQQKKSVAEGEREQEAKNRKSKRHTTARTMGGKLRSAWRRLLRRNEEGSGRSVLGFVVDFLDLRLLKDPSYVNLALGLSVSCLSDTNFFTVLPFHLQRTLGFSPADVAVCLSAAAGADVASRLLLPLLGDHLRLQKRTAYLLGCLTSAIARSIFVLVEDFPSVVAFCALVGFLKGTMVVNLALTIAEHCCLEKFAAAFGLYMIMSGIITISLGPLIGVVRDWSESYELCIHVLSGVLLLCAIPWLLEMAVVRWRKRRKPAL